LIADRRSPNVVRRTSLEAAVDFAVLAFWAETRRKTSKINGIHFAKRNEAFRTLVVSP
jgi:hypothetical protein